MVVYGTTAIPSDQIEVVEGGTVSVSLAFDNTVGLIGGMDTANGTAATGEVTQVSSPSDARDAFGQGSELHQATQNAFQNGAGIVYAFPVAETEVTGEDPSSGTSGQLANSPVMDPNIHDEHEIVDQNGNDVNVSYDVPSETVSGTEAYVDPVTGEFKGDSGTTYSLDYTHGDYSVDAVSALLDESPRIVNVLTESTSVVNGIVTDVNDRATDFDFMHIVAGAHPSVDPSSYTDSMDERRVSLVYPSRGFVDDAETDQHRVTSSVSGYLAGINIGLSSTNDSIGGFTGLLNELAGPPEAGSLIDEQVMPLLDYPPITIAKDMTTSQTPKFERVYVMQIVDEMTEAVHTIAREFVGEQNTNSNRQTLRRSIENALIGASNASPPLLVDYTVSVSQDDADPNQTNVTIGLQPVPMMDTIDVQISVGDIVRNEGAS